MATPLEGMSRDDLVRGIEHVIRDRRTRKVLGDTGSAWSHPTDVSAAARSAFDSQVQQAIAIAGWAPFHHSRKALDVCGEQPIHEPWRFYYLDRVCCTGVLAEIDRVLDSEVRRGKIPGLLSGAGGAVLVTWLPESPTVSETLAGSAESESPQPDRKKLQLRNEEHLAASAAAVQNLLLCCEARGMETYWSSGGLLRDPRMFRLLDIPESQRLLAAVFIAPPLAEFDGHIDCKPGGLREARSSAQQWCRRVRLAE